MSIKPGELQRSAKVDLYMDRDRAFEEHSTTGLISPAAVSLPRAKRLAHTHISAGTLAASNTGGAAGPRAGTDMWPLSYSSFASPDCDKTHRIPR